MASTATSLAKWLRRAKVSSLRLPVPCRVSPRDSIAQVVRTMDGRSAGFVLVMDGANGADGTGKLAGIFTERDFVNRVVAAGLDVSLPVERVMTADPKVVRRTSSVHAAVEMM